jgi:hypothetical protein
MNVKLFKKLIKDAVTEAIHEELPDLINEALVKQQKQALREGRSLNFTSNDVATVPLSGDVRSALAAKMGAEFGFNPQMQAGPKLEVIDAVDDSTGEKVNPYLAFLVDSASTMTPQERSGLRQLE